MYFNTHRFVKYIIFGTKVFNGYFQRANWKVLYIRGYQELIRQKVRELCKKFMFAVGSKLLKIFK